MVRWDNVFLVVTLILLTLATRELLIVLSLHGDSLRELYEATFSPRLRPILKLDLVLLALAIVHGRWRAMRRGRRKNDEVEK